MGQYYAPLILDKDDRNKVVRWWYSHDFKYNNGKYTYSVGLKLMEHSFIGNKLVANVEHFLLNNPQPLVWEGDYADNTLFGEMEIPSSEPDEFKISEIHNTYVVNHEKMEYYKRPAPSKEKLVVNPLPLLTNEGNGRGGGDYHILCDEDEMLIGSWARNIIGLQKRKPGKKYTEIFPTFKVDWDD